MRNDKQVTVWSYIFNDKVPKAVGIYCTNCGSIHVGYINSCKRKPVIIRAHDRTSYYILAHTGLNKKQGYKNQV